MVDIREQKLLYHLTAIANVESILAEGLKPRAQLEGFEDVADSEILRRRQALGLEQYVPFHWFSRNPFDGGVQASRPNQVFVIIAVRRTLAARHDWKIVPRHPLAREDIQLLDYAVGFNSIDWNAMNQRDYQNPLSKSVCMAECLSPNPVPATDFFRIYAPSLEVASQVNELIRQQGLALEVAVNEGMFLR